MAKPQQPEKGVRGYRKFRYGRQPGMIGSCTGVDRSHDKSTLGPNALREGINARIHDSIVVSRGGQTLAANTVPGYCVQGMIEVKGAGPRALVLADSDIYIFDESAGPTDADKFKLTALGGPVLQQTGFDTYTISGTQRYSFFWWNGQIMQVHGSYLYRITVPEDGNDPTEVIREEVIELKVPGEAGTFTVGGVVVLPAIGDSGDAGPIYMTTGGGGCVAYYDGQLVRLLADASGPQVPFVLPMRVDDTLVIAGGDKAMWMSGWAQGSSPVSGSWSTLAWPTSNPPSGVGTDFRVCSAMGYMNHGFVGGFDDDITARYSPSPYKGMLAEVKFNASGNLVMHTVHNRQAINSYDGLIIQGGKLLYMHRSYSPASNESGYIGTYDGTTFTDQAFSLGGENGANHLALATNEATRAVSYHGSEVSVTFDCGSTSIDLDSLYSIQNPAKDVIFL